MTCQHPGCQRTSVVECLGPELIDLAVVFDLLTSLTEHEWYRAFIKYYCLEHAHRNGYCWHCGFLISAQDALRREAGICRKCEGYDGRAADINGLKRIHEPSAVYGWR